MLTGDVGLPQLRKNDNPDKACQNNTQSRSALDKERASAVYTYKPAKVNIAVNIICCLIVVRRRHSNGIGYQNVSLFSPPEELYLLLTSKKITVFRNTLTEPLATKK